MAATAANLSQQRPNQGYSGNGNGPSPSKKQGAPSPSSASARNGPLSPSSHGGPSPASAYGSSAPAPASATAQHGPPRTSSLNTTSQVPPGTAYGGPPGQNYNNAPSGQAYNNGPPRQANNGSPGQGNNGLPRQASNSALRQTYNSPSGQANNNSSGQAYNGPPGQAYNSPSGQTNNGSPGQGNNGPPRQASNGALRQTYNSPSGQANNNSSGQAYNGPSGQGPPGQAYNGPSGQINNGPPGQAYNGPSGQTYNNGPNAGSGPGSAYGGPQSAGGYSNPPSASAGYSNPPSASAYSNPPSASAYSNAPSASAFGNGPSASGYSNPSSAHPMSVYAEAASLDGSSTGYGGDSARQSRVVSQSAPILDQSHLRPGKQAELLSHDRTLELYRENAKKTNDPELIFEFAVFMIDAAKSMIPPEVENDPNPPPTLPKLIEKRDELTKEATALLKRLADRGFPDAQYFLADCYANGIGTVRGKQDFDRAFPLFVLAAKHGHPDACYRAGSCCEHGWGCRRESAKALQFYKKAAVGLHPGAMYRLGTAELNGSLGLNKRPKEGVKWLKRSAEHATEEFPHALHELALLHERGLENVVFVDLDYAAELLAQAAEFGYAPSSFKLGECYEFGRMGCPMDPALSIHYYNIAAQQSHPQACFALTAWYLVGSDGVLPQSDTEAYLWAKKAAELGLVKAMYTIGYFTETGVGTDPNLGASMKWYKQAAEKGDPRAVKRLNAGNTKGAGSSALDRRLELEAMKEERFTEKGGKEGCLIM